MRRTDTLTHRPKKLTPVEEALEDMADDFERDIAEMVYMEEDLWGSYEELEPDPPDPSDSYDSYEDLYDDLGW